MQFSFLKPLLRDNECYRRLLSPFSSENATFLSEEGLNDLALLEWQSEPDTSSTIFDGPPSPTGEGLYITSPKVTYRAFRKKGISNRAKRDISNSSFVNVFRESEYIDSPKAT